MSDRPDELNPNPIVALAMRIRARRELDSAIDETAGDGRAPHTPDAGESLVEFAERLNQGTRRLNSILGRNGVTFVRLERPLRIRLRFGEKRVRLDLDDPRQLVIVSGLELDGEYQFDSGAAVPALINLSKLSTEAGYGEPLTPSVLLKVIARDAELPRPAHLDDLGPLKF
ncbi:MAG: hypothetical protein ACREM6_09155 [Vulcanimicrobiaceae bacterium]